MNLRSRVPFELIVIYKFIISKKINYTSKRESDREKWQAQLIVLKDKGKQRKERFTFTLFKGENKREKGKKKSLKLSSIWVLGRKQKPAVNILCSLYGTKRKAAAAQQQQNT
jgi:hypothetical protein